MKQQKNNGFSLIEVIIAMAIFTIGALGLYGMQINSATWNTRANQQTSAVLVASQIVEQLMQTNFSDPALNFTDTTTTDDCFDNSVSDDCYNENALPALTFAFAPGQTSFIRAVGWIVNVVPDISGQPITNMKQVHVTVRYGTDTRNRDVDMSFLKVDLSRR